MQMMGIEVSYAPTIAPEDLILAAQVKPRNNPKFIVTAMNPEYIRQVWEIQIKAYPSSHFHETVIQDLPLVYNICMIGRNITSKAR